jgi:hypothetical protein
MKENKITKAKYRSGFRRGLKVDLCVEHKDWIKSKSATDLAELIYNN